MSTEEGAAAKHLSSEGTGTGINTANLEQQQHHEQSTSTPGAASTTTQQSSGGGSTTSSMDLHGERQNQQENTAPIASGAAGAGESSPSAAVPAAGTDSGESPRQVIAVSASKSPAAFFNLARKFLVTNEMCDLSALEGAIVSAVDAAHLLERSQLATIVRIHTSYVSVEPKRKKPPSPHGEKDVLVIQSSQSSPTGSGVGAEVVAATAAASHSQSSGTEVQGPSDSAQTVGTSSSQSTRRGSSGGGRELRRARIVVTVRRTESYKRWLEENPLQAIIASEVDEDEETVGPAESAVVP